ncbi:hypothetical protein BCR42DRAFT_496524 [Absidia repens]|uniref:BZIP domain-containing protein n=1 Tax=Absidia repens TaxID=90262 RepID=A0A1X2I0H1_9FUNG|nr:hypothetical protein BCR42DRAFT_496524 [Absidia repens]
MTEHRSPSYVAQFIALHECLMEKDDQLFLSSSTSYQVQSTVVINLEVVLPLSAFQFFFEDQKIKQKYGFQIKMVGCFCGLVGYLIIGAKKMTDTLDTSLSPPTDNDTSTPIVDNKRNATDDISENLQSKIRRTSTTPADDRTSTNLTTQKDDNMTIATDTTGQDLAQLTASSLAQAMVSPISVPGFNLLQQLQAGNIITALPGPPGGLGLNGNQQEQQQEQQTSQPSARSKIKIEEPTEDTGKSSTLDIQINDVKTVNNDNDTTTSTGTAASSISPSSSTAPTTSSPDAAVAAAAARHMSNDERRQRRLLRNRVAAKECRKKKKQYIQDMEDKIARLEEENATLQRQLEDAKNKLAFSTMEGPESYRLMKEVEELNAKLGLGQQLSAATATADSSTEGTAVTQSTSSTADTTSSSELDAVISVIANIQQRHEQQQQQQQQMTMPTSSTSLSSTIPAEKDSTKTLLPTAAPTSPSSLPNTGVSATSPRSTPPPINGSSSPVPTSALSASSSKLDIETVEQTKDKVKVE